MQLLRQEQYLIGLPEREPKSKNYPAFVTDLTKQHSCKGTDCKASEIKIAWALGKENHLWPSEANKT